MDNKRAMRMAAAACWLSLPTWSACAVAAAQYQFVDLGAVPSAYYSEGLGAGGGAQAGYVAYIIGQPGQLVSGHATVWRGTPESYVDLHPATGWSGTRVNATNGAWQVGQGITSEGAGPRALLWQGSTESMVDLTPAGSQGAEARSVAGQQVVGTSYSHGAAMWIGPQHNFVPLAPDGIDSSAAYGTDGVQQVGSASGSRTGGRSHAFLWSGTPESALDLTPTGFFIARAVSVAGGQQVGYGFGDATTGLEHALLWQGSAESMVDLNPTGFASSRAVATNGRQQVGHVDGLGAVVWNGSPDSYTGLNAFLPQGWSNGGAMAIDELGNIVGSALPLDGGVHAVMWIPVPEPASALVPLLVLAVRRRRGRTAFDYCKR